MDHKTDRAITRPEQDLLGRQRFVETLGKALIEEVPASSDRAKSVRSKGVVIGLTGEWGSGKSSIVNLLAEHLGSRSRVIVVNFNPWMFQSHLELLDGFFSELRYQLGCNVKNEFKELLSLLDKYRDAVSAAGQALNAIKPGVGVGVEVALKFVPKGRKASAQESRKDLERNLSKLDLAIVVLVDELDRVEDDEVRAVARLVKAVGDIQGISYLVAYDPKRVIDALGRGQGQERLASGEAYLEKIIQLVVPIRPLLDYEVKAMLLNTLEVHGYTSGYADQDRALDTLLPSLTTPRDIKRLVGNFAAIEPMVHGEVFSLDVLFYAYLLVKAPTLREVLAKRFDEVVDDPPERIVMARVFNKVKPTVENVFGEVTQQQNVVLQWLFPILGKQREAGFDRDRISKRRNLLRLLYLGNPPHDIPREEIERFWNSHGVAAEAHFREVITSGRLADFLERLRDLLPSLPPRQDRTIWPAISRALVRPRDWMAGFEPGRSAVDDLDDIIRTLDDGQNAKGLRAAAILRYLIKAGDLTLVPAILRSHVFKYGLSEGAERPRSELPSFLTEAELRDIIRSEVPKYRDAIKSGYFLRRIIDVDAIFLLSNLQLFDAELRAQLTKQLEGLKAISTFAALMVPPGYVIDRDVLNGLVDCDLLQKQMSKVSFRRVEKLNPWLLASWERLRKVLSNRSLMDHD